MEVNQKELAKILGMTSRHVRRLREEYGLFAKKDGKRTYTLETCVPEYIEYKLNEAGKAGNAFNKEKQQAEHEKVKKEISIMKLRKLKRQLHEAEDVEIFLEDMLYDFKEQLLSFPHKVSPLIVGEDDVNIIAGLLEKEIYLALSKLSEYDPEKIDGEDNDIYGDEYEEEED